MRCQMMRVISSPSISTTGFFTAIFAMADEPLLLRARTCGGESGMPWGRRLMARRATSRKSKTRAELRADRSMDFTRAQVHRRRAGVLERVCVCDQQTSGEIRGSARNCDHPGCRSAPPGLHVECMRHKETYEGMPGAGTDKTKNWIETPGPIIVLVEPQLGENIGAAARAMANFALKRLRLVKPRDGWPNVQARRAASGADRILDEAQLYDTVEAAIADCTLVLATTARAHDQAKPVISPDAAAALLAPHVVAGENVAVLFGRERYGLENDEVAVADRIVTFPVNPAFASLNLAQAVAVVAYEWFKLACGGALPFAMPQRSPPAGQEQVQAFFAHLEHPDR